MHEDRTRYNSVGTARDNIEDKTVTTRNKSNEFKQIETNRTNKKTYKRNDIGSSRNGLGDEQLVHGHREEYGDAERDLLARLRRKVKDEDADADEQDARKDEVVGEEHRLPAHDDRVGDVDVRLVAARVELDVPVEQRVTRVKGVADDAETFIVINGMNACLHYGDTAVTLLLLLLL